jgi:hypothetical protein
VQRSLPYNNGLYQSRSRHLSSIRTRSITALTTGTTKGAGRIRPSPAFASSSYCMDYRNWFRCTIWTTRFILATATEFFVTRICYDLVRGESPLRVCHNHSAISAQAAIQHNVCSPAVLFIPPAALHTFYIVCTRPAPQPAHGPARHC